MNHEQVEYFVENTLLALFFMANKKITKKDIKML